MMADWLGVAYTVTVAGLSVFGPGQHPAPLRAVGVRRLLTLRPVSFMSGSAPTAEEERRVSRGGEG